MKDHTTELYDYYRDTELVTEGGGEFSGDEMEELIAEHGALALHIWEGHGIYYHDRKGRKTLVAWEEGNSPLCAECNGTGKLCENGSYDNDPANDEETECPDCEGLGLRDDWWCS